MRLIATGGGTGGHIYPALEVARVAAQRGAEIVYLGSIRGQERDICSSRGIRFYGFPSAPLYSLRTPRGWRSAAGLLRATIGAKAKLRELRPDAVISTGGYSAAPVMHAARSLHIPYVIHEANSVPGRSNLMFAKRSYAFTYLFNATAKYLQGLNAHRVGNPIRRELREAAKEHVEGEPLVLVLGGSQGSVFLNDLCPKAARPGVRFLHAAGRSNKMVNLPAGYEVVPYLETSQIVEAYRTATVAVSRSGSTLAEFAMFGLPSVLVPLPTSADDHQLHNALEFADMHAATVLTQDRATPEALAAAIGEWLEHPEKRAEAARALHAWDVPDSAQRIVALIEEVAKK